MTLDALRAVIPVLSEKEQSACIGGGSGSELTPFSMEEFTGLFHDGIWKGGYVQLENDGLSSSICYVSSTGGIENYSGDSAVGVKALAARIGSGSVDDEPTPNHDGCTCGTDCDPCMTGSGCEDCLARLEGSGLIDDSGLIDNSGELDGICSGCTTCEESGSGCWSECETCHGDEEGDENVIELPEIIVTPGGNSGNSGGDNNSSGSGNSGTDFGGIIGGDIINNNHNSGGNTGGTGNSGNTSNNNTSNNHDSDKVISDDILGKTQFHGFLQSDQKGCFDRCKEMLAEVGCSLNNKLNDIAMATYDKNGRVTGACSESQNGISYIEEQLKKGNPVIVSVDYKNTTSMGSGRNDKAGDHFIIIVGGSLNTGFHYFDPATAYTNKGTSTGNILQYKNGLLIDESTCVGEKYTVSGVRINL